MIGVFGCCCCGVIMFVFVCCCGGVVSVGFVAGFMTGFEVAGGCSLARSLYNDDMYDRCSMVKCSSVPQFSQNGYLKLPISLNSRIILLFSSYLSDASCTTQPKSLVFAD